MGVGIMDPSKAHKLPMEASMVKYVTSKKCRRVFLSGSRSTLLVFVQGYKAEDGAAGHAGRAQKGQPVNALAGGIALCRV